VPSRDELSRLLASDPGEVIARGGARFGEVAGPFADRIVLFGVGEVGQLAIRRLRRAGIEPLAAIDNDPAWWGSRVDGVEVMSPDDATRRFAAAAVAVATLFNPAPVMAQLVAAGWPRVAPWSWLAWHHHEHFLPYFGLDLPRELLAAKADVEWLYDRLADDESRRTLVEQVRWRLDLDPGAQGPAAPTDELYTVPGLLEPSADDLFVDCGAFDGDSLLRLLAHTGGRARGAVVVEADPGNAARLQAAVDALQPELVGSVRVHEVAVGARQGSIRFHAVGTMGSAADAVGEIEVPVETLDALLVGVDASYLKLDIEGAEPAALQGARGVIDGGRAAWAVCGYHAAEHLWTLPRYFAESDSAYRLHLRRYAADCWELVHYAVPIGRTVQ
jgi:FkbM family methyltransferase